MIFADTNAVSEFMKTGSDPVLMCCGSSIHSRHESELVNQAPAVWLSAPLWLRHPSVARESPRPTSARTF